jgi:hypothetical protein
MSDVIGDPVPPELREFEAESERISQTAHGKVQPPLVEPERTKSARH